MMPVMNGFEFRQQQLRWPDLRDIPVIVYSGVTDATRNARHLNAAAYVGKPIDLDGLLQLVRRECPK
jgi:CheY-like chemotaxis protein